MMRPQYSFSLETVCGFFDVPQYQHDLRVEREDLQFIVRTHEDSKTSPFADVYIFEGSNLSSVISEPCVLVVSLLRTTYVYPKCILYFFLLHKSLCVALSLDFSLRQVFGS